MKNLILTAIIQIYRPCKNEEDIVSVYNQHRAWQEDDDPIATFDRDLLLLINTMRGTGHRIILMGDFNMQFRQKKNTMEKALEQRDIINPITSRYGRTRAPNTHAWGSYPIDAIFCSWTIEMIRGGFDEGMDEISDHRAIWMDITMDTILGVDRGVFQKPITRKLQIRNKNVTRRFNRHLEQYIDKHGLIEKAQTIMEIARSTGTLTQLQEKIFKTVDEQRRRAVTYANNRCAKTPSDDIDFSPTVQKATGMAVIRAEIEKRTRAHRHVHMRWLQPMRERWRIEQFIEIPANLEEAKSDTKIAREKLKEIKRRAPELRRDFLEMLIRQVEDKGLTQKAEEIRTIQDCERMRETHKRIKIAQGKIRGGGVKFVERHNPDGTRTTIKDKEEMEKEIMVANKRKLHSADKSPIRQGKLQAIITDHDYKRWESILDGKVQLPITMEEGTRRWLVIAR